MANELQDQIEQRLSWYYAVLRDQKPAKYLICKSIGSRKDPSTMSNEELWNEHTLLSRHLVDVWSEAEASTASLDIQGAVPFSLLDVKVELLNRILKKCTFCEWKCKVDRTENRKGACHMGDETRVATFFRHFGEEPPLVDRKGSGTIFFTGCTFRCVFCQNWDISQNPTSGAPVSPSALALIMKSLRSEGAANINLVGGEPTPQLHTIMEALRLARVNVPILWNSNMYLTKEAMEILADVVDIWLPDFKWGNDKCAVKYSRIIRYFDVVSRNHQIAHETGDIIIRHLLVPGHIDCCTKPILEWLAEFCPRGIVNVMGQYRPEYLVASNPKGYPEIARSLTSKELGEAKNYAEELHLTCVA